MQMQYKKKFGTSAFMNCGACGTTGVKPRIVQSRDRYFIYTEAKYICPRCGEYFHKGAISKEEIRPESDSAE
jgi:ribosomal protein S27AE